MRLQMPRVSLKAFLLAVSLFSCLLAWKVVTLHERRHLLQQITDGQVDGWVVLLDNDNRWGMEMGTHNGIKWRAAGEPWTALNYEIVQEVYKRVDHQSLWQQLWGDPAVVEIWIYREVDVERYKRAFPEAEVSLPRPRLETLQQSDAVMPYVPL